MKHITLVLVAALSLCGQTKIDIDAQTRGTLPVNRGGTGQTTQQAAIDALVPSQTAKALHVLQTDGTNVSWQLPIRGYAFASLPTPAPGTLVVLTDAATAGSCASGGGSAFALCRYNGSGWDAVGDGGSGGGSLAIENNGSAVGSEPTLNFIPGTGILQTVVDAGSKINYTPSVDTATILSRAQGQSGGDNYCAPSSGSGSNYTCTLDFVPSSYANGMVLQFRPDVNSSAGAVTVNAGPATVNIKQLDGVTDPGEGALVAGRGYLLFFDGTVFRVIAGLPSGSSTGTVTSVGLSMPSEFSVSGSPVTTNGLLTVTKANQTANTVFAGPSSGGAAAPSFRPLVSSDLPTTTVTPGSYTNANVTVDATGRITAASNGSASQFSLSDITSQPDKPRPTIADTTVINDVDASALKEATLGALLEQAFFRSDARYLRESWVSSFVPWPFSVYGELNWARGGNGTLFQADGTPGRPGILRVTSSDSSGSLHHIALMPNGGSENSLFPVTDITTKSGWRHKFRIQTPETSDFQITCGLTGPTFYQSYGVYIQYSTAMNDTDWMAVTHNGSSSTRVSTGVPFAANTQYDLEVFSTIAGEMSFAINGVTTNSGISSTLPNAGILPGCMIKTFTNATKSFDFDEYWGKLLLQ